MKVSSSQPEGSFSKVLGYVVVGFAVAVLVGVLLTAVIVALAAPARASQPAAVRTHVLR